MLKNQKLGVKLIGGFLAIVLLMGAFGVTAYWGVTKMDRTSTDAQARLNDAIVAQKVTYWTIAQYRMNAETIINKNPEAKKGFEEAAAQFDENYQKLASIVDTEREKEWLAVMKQADAEFDEHYYQDVVPEVEHELQNLIGQYDAEADEHISRVTELADKLIESIREELDEAAAASNDRLLVARIEQLLAVTSLKTYAIQQYQNQADLIINKDMELVNQFHKTAAEMDSFISLSRKAVDTDSEKKWLAELEQANESFRRVFNEKVIPEVTRINEKRLLAYDNEIDKHVTEIDDMAQKISGSLLEEAKEAVSQFEDAHSTVNSSVVGFSIIAALIGMALGIILTKSITGPVSEITEVADSIALGDLSKEIAIEQGDEIGQLADSFRRMKESLLNKASTLEKIADRDLTVDVRIASDRDVLGLSMKKMVLDLNDALDQVSQGVEQITIAGGQINTSAQNVAEGASEQASSVEEISSSLEEVTSMSKQNADNASQAQVLAREANDSAENGNASMVRMEEAIKDIKKSSDDTAKIVKTIDEIAFQTNLLALNAAVEAARAGEAGKGFAVVAGEVRKLAMRSAEAAKNTAAMIEQAVGSAENGVKITDEVAKSLMEIAEKSNKVNNLVAEIAAASNEQAMGISQVNGAISEMDRVTQRNAANSEESASAAEELNGQAKTLASMVEQFELLSSNEQRKARKTSNAGSRKAKAAVVAGNGGNGRASMTHEEEEALIEVAASGNGGRRPEELIPLDEDSKRDFSGF